MALQRASSRIPPHGTLVLHGDGRSLAQGRELAYRERRERFDCRERRILLVRKAESEQRHVWIARERIVHALGDAQTGSVGSSFLSSPPELSLPRGRVASERP